MQLYLFSGDSVTAMIDFLCTIQWLLFLLFFISLPTSVQVLYQINKISLHSSSSYSLTVVC